VVNDRRPPASEELDELARRYPELCGVLLGESDRRPPPPGFVTVAQMRELLARPLIEQAAAVIEQATAEPMGLPMVGSRRASPDWPRTLLIGSERDAAEAFGEDSGLHRHVRSFFASPRAEPLVLAPIAARPEPKRAVVSVLHYPRQAPDGLANDAIDIELEDVRAARGIRVQYDFHRDGFVISAQPDPGESGPSAGEHDQRYFEVAFVPAWHETTDEG
jgi:hypothetical protein